MMNWIVENSWALSSGLYLAFNVWITRAFYDDVLSKPNKKEIAIGLLFGFFIVLWAVIVTLTEQMIRLFRKYS